MLKQQHAVIYLYVQIFFIQDDTFLKLSFTDDNCQYNIIRNMFNLLYNDGIPSCPVFSMHHSLYCFMCGIWASPSVELLLY